MAIKYEDKISKKTNELGSSMTLFSKQQNIVQR